MNRKASWWILSALAVTSLIVGQSCPPIDGGDGGDGGSTGNSGITGQYAGASACAACHTNDHTNWSGTNHAGALDTLEAIGNGENAGCIGCHTVGYGEAGGFVDRATTDDLAGVGCESCHGPAAAHVANVMDPAVRPVVSLASEVCGTCHTDDHHPTMDEWETSGHAVIDEHVGEGLTAGQSGRLSGCGVCHSTDAFVEVQANGGEIADDALLGVEHDDLNAVECAACHDPHMQTGLAVDDSDEYDAQLRFAELAYPTPSIAIDDATNPDRFNLCGQCHHSRGRAWDAASRGPHHSVQANVYAGEMAVPDGEVALVPSRVSVHSGAPKQCATCHMATSDFAHATVEGEEDTPADTGHAFTVNFNSCAAANCHNSATEAETKFETLEIEVAAKIADIAARLGDPTTWDYTSDGGPDSDGQALISEEIMQVRFIYHYVINDGSEGLHNPDFVRAMLAKADALLISIGQ